MHLVERYPVSFLALVIALFITIDQGTKLWILSLWEHGQLPTVVTPFFSLVCVLNTGISFGFLKATTPLHTFLLGTLTLVIALGLVIWYVRGGSTSLRVGLALVLAGALGNLIDRIWYGGVIDFICVHWHHWSFPAFNVADSCITAGTAFLLLHAWQQEK